MTTVSDTELSPAFNEAAGVDEGEMVEDGGELMAKTPDEIVKVPIQLCTDAYTVPYIY